MYRWFAGLALAFAVCAFNATVYAGPIIDGREWYQPADITGFSWSQFRAACHYNGAESVCTGQLGVSGPDLSGWVWASVDDVDALFNAFLGADILTGRSNYTQADSAWAPAFFSEFQPALTTPFGRSITGLTSFAVGFGLSTLAVTGALFDAGLPQGTDEVTTAGLVGLNTTDDSIGGWLYRDVAQAPTPGTVLLIGVGLCALGLISRRRQE